MWWLHVVKQFVLDCTVLDATFAVEELGTSNRVHDNFLGCRGVFVVAPFVDEHPGFCISVEVDFHAGHVPFDLREE